MTNLSRYTVRRHPRTLAEAFGPYTNHELQPMPERRDYSASWWAWMAVCAVVTVVLVWVMR